MKTKNNNNEVAAEQNNGINNDRVTVEGMVVTTKFTCTPAQGQEGRSFIVKLDYSDYSQDQILQWAQRNRIIDIQNQLRQAYKDGGYETFVELSKSVIVRQAGDAGKSFVAVDKSLKTMEARLLAMTPEQREAELQKLMAMMEMLQK